jgi:hypothetical protein
MQNLETEDIIEDDNSERFTRVSGFSTDYNFYRIHLAPGSCRSSSSETRAAMTRAMEDHSDSLSLEFSSHRQSSSSNGTHHLLSPLNICPATVRQVLTQSIARWWLKVEE